MAEVMAMERGGNDRMNQVFEAHLSTESLLKPTESSDISDRGEFFSVKYGERKFYNASVARRLIQPNSSPAASSSDSSSRRGNMSSFRQRSMPTLGLDAPSNSNSPSLSGRRGVRRVHSSDLDDWEPLSPVSIGVFSNSMSTISTKSTLYNNNSSRSNRRIQVIRESPGKSSTGRLGNVSLDSFIESSNNLDPSNKPVRNNKLDLNTPPIMEVSDRRPSLREFHLDDANKDTRPQMIRRLRSERTFAATDLISEEGSRSNISKGRRALSLDSDQMLLEQPIVREHQLKGPAPVRRRGSMGGRRTSSTERQESLSLENGPVRRRGSMSGRRTSSIERQGPLSLEDGPVRRRGSMSGRRTSSMERLNRRNNSVDSLQGKHRASLSRRNLSLDSEDIMGISPPPARAQRHSSMTNIADSTLQRERPKFTRELCSTSIADMSEHATPETLQRETWMEGKTPRTTGRRKSVGMESIGRRHNSLTGGMNPLDRERSVSRDPSTRVVRHNSLLGSQGGMDVSNHGAGSGILRRGRSKRSFARGGSARSIFSSATETKEAKGEDTDSELSPTRQSLSGDSIQSSSQHRRQGLISGDKRPSRGLGSLRSILGSRDRSNDSDLTSSRLASTEGSRPKRHVAAAAMRTSGTSSSDLASKLHRIDRESRGYTSSEHKSPSSPLTTSTGSKRVARNLHVVLCADGDGDRTFVSTVTGNSSLESHWSLHKERWKA